MCRGDVGQLYILRSSSGIRSTSWKIKQSKSFNFKDSLYPMLKRIALLKGVVPDYKDNENQEH